MRIGPAAPIPSIAAYAAVLCALGSACPGNLCDTKTALVDPKAWELAEASSLFGEPDAPECPAAAVSTEVVGGEDALLIQTSTPCGWVTVEQELATDLRADDKIQLRLFVFSQTLFPGTVARPALAVGDEVVWSEEIPLPTSSHLDAPLIDTVEAPAGTPIQFHIGNHGDNSWHLIEVSRVRQELCPL